MAANPSVVSQLIAPRKEVTARKELAPVISLFPEKTPVEEPAHPRLAMDSFYFEATQNYMRGFMRSILEGRCHALNQYGAKL